VSISISSSISNQMNFLSKSPSTVLPGTIAQSKERIRRTPVSDQSSAPTAKTRLKNRSPASHQSWPHDCSRVTPDRSFLLHPVGPTLTTVTVDWRGPLFTRYRLVYGRQRDLCIGPVDLCVCQSSQKSRKYDPLAAK